MMAHAATLLMMVLLHLWSPIPVLNALAPRDGITATRDIAYAAGDRHTLDVYAPGPNTEPAPVVVFFYGGGWASGDKAMYRFVGADLAAHGLLAVIPDYRLYPEVRFPAFMDDAAAAIAWTRANAAKFGGDPQRLFLMGHSAGAQIATLLALDPGYLNSVGRSPRRDICGVIGLAGPYDFLPAANADVGDIFGPEANWPRSQPINHVSAEAPPMLLLAGQSDHTVDPGNTLRLAARLRAAGGDVQDTLYEGISHRAMIVTVSGALGFLAPVREATWHFVVAHSACGRLPSQSPAAASSAMTTLP